MRTNFLTARCAAYVPRSSLSTHPAAVRECTVVTSPQPQRDGSFCAAPGGCGCGQSSRAFRGGAGAVPRLCDAETRAAEHPATTAAGPAGATGEGGGSGGAAAPDELRLGERDAPSRAPAGEPAGPGHPQAAPRPGACAQAQRIYLAPLSFHQACASYAAAAPSRSGLSNQCDARLSCSSAMSS